MSEVISIRPNLEVEELEPTVTHLRDVLGFEVEVREEAMGLALLRRGGASVAVVRTEQPGVNCTTACYVDVTGVDALHDAFTEGGATVVVPLSDHPWGLRDFVVEIPGGHRLAFGERMA